LGHRDGPAPPRPSGLRRAVPPRVDPDAGGADAAPQLPRGEGVTLREAIQAAIEGRHLSRADAAAAVDAMLDGTAPPTLIAALLIALRVKGETPDEIAGAALALRACAARRGTMRRCATWRLCGRNWASARCSICSDRWRIRRERAASCWGCLRRIS